MAKWILPGDYCKAACDKFTELILNRSCYASHINIETQCCGFDSYFIIVTAPNVGQNELVEDITKLLFTEFGNMILNNKIFLNRYFDEFTKSVDYDQFKTYIMNDEHIKAVKLVKDCVHCGLKEAHDFWKRQKEGYDKIGYFPA